MNKKLLIVGCARSGFAYTTEVLKKFDLDIRHESTMGKHGLISWLQTVLPKETPWGPCNLDRNSFIILHQVRRPLDVISSLQYSALYTWEFIGKYLKLKDDLLYNSMLYWYAWNKIAQKLAMLTYRVEDVDTENKLGIAKTFNTHSDTVVKSSNVTIKKLSWMNLLSVDSFLAEKVRIYSKELGYND